MTNRSRRNVLLRAGCWAALAACAVLAGCSPLLPKPAPVAAQFALDGELPEATPAPRPGAGAPTLVVGTPRAAAGFDTRRIVYLRHAHELESFAYSQWVDTPAQMLVPMIARAIERTGAFRAVLQAPATAVGDLRLDTDLLRLQHEFLGSPSQVRLSLRAVLVDTSTRRVIAWREFDTSIASASDDPYGGVVAANRAVKVLLAELAAFVAESASMAPATR